ncbi:MAG: PIG-L family deacetylase [Chloroflexota bacterium]
MKDPLRLMCILAHPDDESLGTGGILAKYAAEGVETYLVTATRGERGWTGDPAANPGLTALGQMREAELRAAAQVLGLREVAFLDYMDGDLDQADPVEAIARIVDHLRRLRPQVVVTFGPDGNYGHPDHIAISQFTTAAIVCAADPTYHLGTGEATGEEEYMALQPDLPVASPLQAHRVTKLYYAVDSLMLVEQARAVFGDLTFVVDGVERRWVAWEEWAVTTRIDATAHWRTVWQAILCHQSQIAGIQEKLSALPEEQHQLFWGRQNLYRAFSLVNGGRQVENDLFAGLRPHIERG